VDPNLFPIAAGDPYSVYVSDQVLPKPEVSPPSISRDSPLLLHETEWHVHFASQLADPSLRENMRALCVNHGSHHLRAKFSVLGTALTLTLAATARWPAQAASANMSWGDQLKGLKTDKFY
jgi:hypothetical protein